MAGASRTKDGSRIRPRQPRAARTLPVEGAADAHFTHFDATGQAHMVDVETVGRTGVEMEALTAVQVGLLTIYDMCKAADRGMVIGDVRVLEKRGGKSGHWVASP